MFTTFAILGDGAWGTAIALLLARNPEHRVTLWSARAENGRLLQERRENVRLLPGVLIPPAVQLTTDISQAVAGADLWVTAIPTVYLRTTLTRIAAAVPAGPGRMPHAGRTGEGGHGGAQGQPRGSPVHTQGQVHGSRDP